VHENYKRALNSAWNDYVKVNVVGSFSQHIKCLHCATLLKWKQRDDTSRLINPSNSRAKNNSLTPSNGKLTDAGAAYPAKAAVTLLVCICSECRS